MEEVAFLGYIEIEEVVLHLEGTVSDE